MIFAPTNSFVILLLLQEAISTFTWANLSNEYDITTVLNDTIVGIFHSVQPPNASDLIRSIENIEHANIYEYHNLWTFRFRNTRIRNVQANETRIRYGFHNNSIQIYNPGLIVHLSAYIEKKWQSKGHQTYNIDTVLRFNDSVLTAIALPNNSRTPFYIVPESNHTELEMEGISEKDPWAIRRIKPLIPSVFRDDMNHNKELLRKLKDGYGGTPKKHLISKYPNFLENEHRYYYLIPKFSIGRFDLTNIVVKGLTNFHSLDFNDKSNPLVYTLLIKDLRGEMTLETGSKNETSSLQLNFYADSISISTVRETNCISVEGRNYSFVRTKSNTTLAQIHSIIMIDCFESALASSLMPSMKFRRTNRMGSITSTSEIENSIRQMIMAV